MNKYNRVIMLGPCNKNNTAATQHYPQITIQYQMEKIIIACNQMEKKPLHVKRKPRDKLDNRSTLRNK